jgi:hypothetical protein
MRDLSVSQQIQAEGLVPEEFLVKERRIHRKPAVPSGHSRSTIGERDW